MPSWSMKVDNSQPYRIVFKHYADSCEAPKVYIPGYWSPQNKALHFGRVGLQLLLLMANVYDAEAFRAVVSKHLQGSWNLH